MPRLEHIWPVRLGHELPAKIRVLRILLMWLKGRERESLTSRRKYPEFLKTSFNATVPGTVLYHSVIVTQLYTTSAA